MSFKRLVIETSVLTGVLVVLLTFCCNNQCFAGSKPSQIHPQLEDYLQRIGYYAIPLKRGAENHLQIRGRVGGKEQEMELDSGCSITRVDRRLARNLKTLGTLGVELKDSYLGLVTNAECVLLESVELGQARFTNQLALPAKLSIDGRRMEEQVILGCDFFFRNYCIIDCSDCRLYVRNTSPAAEARDALKKSLLDSGFHEIQISTSLDLVMTCEPQINGARVRLVVDTGAVWSTLDDDIARRLHLTWRITPSRLGGVGDIGVHNMAVARLKSFQLGDVESKNMLIAVAQLEHWGLAEKSQPLRKIDGLLGADWLAINEGLIDFRGRTLWLRPPKPK